MSLLETLSLALSALKANKLRSGLTMLGIAVGVFSVIGVMTVISGLRGSIETGLNVLGANSFQIQKYPRINFSNPRLRFANRPDISYPHATRFRALMGSSAEVSLQLWRGGVRAAYLDRQTNPNVRLLGTDENYVTGLDYDIVAGRNLGPGDVEFARPVVVIGHDLVESLFVGEDPVGRPVRLDGRSFTVVGVLGPKGVAFGDNRDNLVAIPITRFLDIYGRSGRTVGINVQAPGQLELETVFEQAIGAMRLVRGLGPEDPNDFELYSNDSLIEAFNNIAGVVAVGAFVISAIALLASGVGVMNIMLVSVTERTREIGIRKSIGAKKRNILVQFLIEATTLSIIGGVAGIIGGVVGGNVAATYFNAVVVFPWGWAAAGLLVCSAIGIGFGLYPAWKAASLDPIEALRHE